MFARHARLPERLGSRSSRAAFRSSAAARNAARADNAVGYERVTILIASSSAGGIGAGALGQSIPARRPWRGAGRSGETVAPGSSFGPITDFAATAGGAGTGCIGTAGSGGGAGAVGGKGCGAGNGVADSGVDDGAWAAASPATAILAGPALAAIALVVSDSGSAYPAVVTAIPNATSDDPATRNVVMGISVILSPATDCLNEDARVRSRSTSALRLGLVRRGRRDLEAEPAHALVVGILHRRHEPRLLQPLDHGVEPAV